MEFINKVELRGVVGRANTIKVADKPITRFSLVTEYVTHPTTDKKGRPIPTVEVTWWNCTLDAEKELKQGDIAHIVGRIRTTTYTDANNIIRHMNEVVVNAISIEKRAEDEQK